MSIYTRRLFNRGGKVSSRGVGITSGLVPVQKFDNGGEVKKYEETLQKLRDMNIISEREPFSKFEALAPGLLAFFGGLMTGRSPQTGVPGGFDILGTSLQQATPLFAQALKEKREYDAVDPEAPLKQIALEQAFKDTTKEKKLVGEPDEVYGTFQNDPSDVTEKTGASRFVFEDGSVEYRIGDKVYTSYTPFDKPEDYERKSYEKSIKIDDEFFIQNMVSLDGGKSYEAEGDPYPRFKLDKEKPAGFEYKFNTTENALVDGKEVKNTYAVFINPETEAIKQVLMTSEDVTKPLEVRKSGNIIFKEGQYKGKTYGAVELKDGTVKFYSGTDDKDADERGLVTATDSFEFFSQAVTSDDKASLFGEQDIEQAVVDIATASQTLSDGSNLVSSINAIGGNIDSLNRSILDTGGKFLSQFPGGEVLKEGLFELFDADPRLLQEFLTNSRIFVAQNISTITGEGSARISEPERELANEALALITQITDAESAVASVQATMASTYIQQHRQKIVAGVESYKISDPQGKEFNGIPMNEKNALYHANILKKQFGFSDSQIANLLTRMAMMENLGLNQLTQITQAQNDYFRDNKDDINNNYFALTGENIK